jgi:hypothetical protein
MLFVGDLTLLVTVLFKQRYNEITTFLIGPRSALWTAAGNSHWFGPRRVFSSPEAEVSIS